MTQPELIDWILNRMSNGQPITVADVRAETGIGKGGAGRAFARLVRERRIVKSVKIAGSGTNAYQANVYTLPTTTADVRTVIRATSKLELDALSAAVSIGRLHGGGTAVPPCTLERLKALGCLRKRRGYVPTSLGRRVVDRCRELGVLG